MTPHELLEAHGVRDIEGPLMAHLGNRRWFGERGQPIDSVALVDAAVLRAGEPTMVFLLAEVRFSSGAAPTTYDVPLGIRRGVAPVGEEHVISRLPAVDAELIVYDALADGECAVALWEAIAAGKDVPTCGGALEISSASPSPPAARPDEISPQRGEQSNTSLVRAGREFLKYLRRLDPGPSIELEMVTALTEQGFEHLAPITGTILYRRADGRAASPVAILQPFLAGGKDGWALALTSVRRLYDAVGWGDGGVSRADRPSVERAAADFAGEAARIGELSARMHLALAADGLRADMAPQALSAALLRGWADEMGRQLERLRRRPGIPAAIADELSQRAGPIAAAFAALRELDPAGLAIRVHGDYHLGQLMRRDEGWYVLDFEGEPNRPATQRRQRYSPLRDVAGMLRSFDYAAAVALAERIGPQDARWPALMEVGESWSRACRDAFWRAYRSAITTARLLPEGDGAAVLRRAFEVDKAIYELDYELGHRPSWTAIPMRYVRAASGG